MYDLTSLSKFRVDLEAQRLGGVVSAYVTLFPMPATYFCSFATQKNNTKGASEPPAKIHHFPAAPNGGHYQQQHQPQQHQHQAAVAPRRRANSHRLTDAQVFDRLRAIVSPGDPLQKYQLVEKIGQG
ncbi:unnamed protein product [Dibothriocephalus latus]|uniref:Uncharacterized protein n=1 Tax=Dibothriocephalus latus TaxID=60516 RepID=A0A3P7NIR4_DIBLA|nr:unnamed protein product [Dibothriocephalus latus]